MTAPTRAELADSVDSVRFTPVRLREGYAMGDVDAFLDRLAAAVRAGADVKEMVDGSRFATRRGRESYDMAEVDDFLDRVVRDAATTVTAGAPTASDASRKAEPAEHVPSGPTGLNPEVIGLIRTTRLSSRMLAEGYDKAAVDSLLNQLIQRLDVGHAFDDLMLDRLPRRRGGYTTADVDGLIEKVRYGARYA